MLIWFVWLGSDLCRRRLRPRFSSSQSIACSTDRRVAACPDHLSRPWKQIVLPSTLICESSAVAVNARHAVPAQVRRNFLIIFLLHFLGGPSTPAGAELQGRLA